MHPFPFLTSSLSPLASIFRPLTSRLWPLASGLLFLTAHAAPAQSIHSALQGKQVKKNFTAAVDQLDEFIDRFNHNDPMFLEAFPNRPRRPMSAERAFLVKSLLNPKAKLDEGVTAGFIKQVTNPAAPRLLSLSDHDWYAALSCTYTLDGRPVSGRLVLKFERDSGGVSAWRVMGATGTWLTEESATIQTLPARATRRRGLNPAAHGNGFIALHRAFLSPESFGENLSDSASRNARVLAALVQNERLKLNRVTHIVYHFLQVDNYIFTVSDVDAPEGEPSGFLISRLLHTDAEAKRKYRRSILHVEG